MRRFATSALAGALAVSMMCGARAASVHVRAQPSHSLASAVAHARNLTDLGPLRSTEPVQVGLLMAVQHESELHQLVLLQGDRRSPQFHHYLSSKQFAQYFAPDSAAYQRTIATLRQHGFTITSTYGNRSFLIAQAPAATVESYFATTLHSVLQPGAGNRIINTTAATMPSDLQGLVVNISGLHTVQTMHHPLRFPNPALVKGSAQYALAVQRHLADVRAAQSNAQNRKTAAVQPAPVRRVTLPSSVHPNNVPTPLSTASPSANPAPDPTLSPDSPSTDFINSIGGYGAPIFADAYDYPVQHGYGGRGHAVANVIEADVLNSDLQKEWAEFGIPHTGNIYRLCGSPGGGPTCFNTIGQPDPVGESTLDAETITGFAPAADLFIYLAPAFDDIQIESAYENIVNDNYVDVVNSSFGGCETDDPSFEYATNYIAMEGGAEGITFVASTGDTGSTNCGTYTLNGAPQSEINISIPSADYYFTALGGTDFSALAQCTGVGSACYTHENAWTFSGGGSSVFGSIPSWQQAAVAAGIPAESSTTMRNTPDIVLNADNLPPGTGYAIYLNGALEASGGTSLASPMFVAMQVEIDQVQKSRNGFVNPGLYAAYQAFGSFAFRDITSGTNGRYQAVPGYDDASGIGSPLGWELASVENGATPATPIPVPHTPAPGPTSPPSSPTPAPTPTPVIIPSPVGTSFAVTTIAGNGNPMSIDGTGTGASLDNPTGIQYVAGAASNAQTDSTIFFTDFATGFLRGYDLTTNAVTTFEDRTWNNATRVTKSYQTSDLLGLTYYGTGAMSTTYGGLYVVSAGDNQILRVTLPTTPDPSATPHSSLGAIVTGGPAAAAIATTGAAIGLVTRSNGSLFYGNLTPASTFTQASTTGLPAGGNYGLTQDGATPANWVVTDSAMNSISKVTETPAMATVTAFTSGAPLNLPKEIVYVSSLSAYFVANCGGNNIVRVDSTGNMTVAAGDGAARELNGYNTGAEFNCPFGITTDGTNLYVTDLSGNTLRKITNLK